MRQVSDEYIAAATSSGRKYDLSLKAFGIIKKKAGGMDYFNEDYNNSHILSLKIVQGQTTGGFQVGGVYSSCLSATLTNDVKIAMATAEDEYVVSYVVVFLSFLKEDGTAETQELGRFLVDTIKKSIYNQTITAYDLLYSKSKVFGSQYSDLTFPMQASELLRRAYDFNPIGDISYINNAEILTFPTMGQDDEGNDIFYTQRDIIGFIAAINGGSAYLNSNEELLISSPKITNYTIHAKNVISQNISGTNFTVNGFVLNNTMTSIMSAPDYKVGTIEFSVPLNFSNSDEIVNNLNNSGLVGLIYDSITIKKQGTAIFQLGDLVNYQGVDEHLYKMLIMGIVYDFSDGFFSETLYSLAKSTSQQQYGGAATKSIGSIVYKTARENFVNLDVMANGIKTDDGVCKYIAFAGEE